MKLRKEVTVSADRGLGGQPVLVLTDRLTKRQFSLPRAAAPVLELLVANRTVAEISGQLGEEYDEETVGNLIEQLGEKHLLEGDTAEDPSAIRAKVGALIRTTRFESLKRALRYASEQVPIYKQKFGGGVLDALNTEEDLHRVPVTIKQDIRDHYPDGFVPDVEDLRSLTLSDAIVRGVSSGTSAGERLQTIHTREIWRKQMISGYLANSKVFPHIDLANATFTSMHCSDPDVCVTHLARMQDRVRNGTRLLLMPPEDPGAPTLDDVKTTLGEIAAHKASWIDCNPTYMAALSYAIVDGGVEVPKIDAMTTGFEFLSAIHRKHLSKVWGCGVYDRFSTSEMGNLVMLECEEGGFHVNDSHYFAEIVRDGRTARPGEVGHLVISTLHERLPMLRYMTRDLMVAAEPGPCKCGSVSTRVAAYAGRLKDILVAADGTPRTQREVDNAIARADGLRFYQIDQKSKTELTLKIVPEPGLDGKQVASRAAEALRDVLGPIEKIDTEVARKIYPETSGKFRFTRSQVPGAEELIVAYSAADAKSRESAPIVNYQKDLGTPEGMVWPTT